MLRGGKSLLLQNKIFWIALPRWKQFNIRYSSKTIHRDCLAISTMTFKVILSAVTCWIKVEKNLFSESVKVLVNAFWPLRAFSQYQKSLFTQAVLTSVFLTFSRPCTWWGKQGDYVYILIFGSPWSPHVMMAIFLRVTLSFYLAGLRRCKHVLRLNVYTIFLSLSAHLG